MNRAELKEKELELPKEHRAVYEVIANSKEKYVTKKMILPQLNKPVSYTRRLNTVIHELVADYDMPVGSSSRKESKGYFIITNEHEHYLAKRDFQTRTFTMNQRYEALERMKF